MRRLIKHCEKEVIKKKKRKRNSKENADVGRFGRSNCEPTTASSKSVLGSDNDIRPRCETILFTAQR